MSHAQKNINQSKNDMNKFFAVELNKVARLSALSLAVALAACGGGGGGGTAATTTTPSVIAATAAVSTIVTSVPASTYLAGSEELAAYNLLNTERTSCGFGKLAQNTALDAAAKNHADWQLISNTQQHTEATGTPGFTGTTPTDQMVTTGYGTTSTIAYATSEIYSILGLSAKAGVGTTGIQSLLNAPYHVRGLLSSARDVGFTMRNDVDAGSTATYGARVLLQADLANTMTAGPQLMGSTDVQTYPCAGSTNIVRLLTQETPNPVPGRDLAATPLGSMVYIAVREGQQLIISNASMINASTGAAVTLRPPVTSANDPYPGTYLPNEAYVAADAPLAANTQYQVTINGTNAGVAFSRTFLFTTGA